MKGKFRKCPCCPELMPRHQGVCRKCFRTLPAEIQTAMNQARGGDARQSAVRRAVTHITGQPELML